MATLHERLIGQNLPQSGGAPDEQKIAIHAFIGAIYEYAQGKITGADFVSFFDLNAAQQSQAQTLYNLISNAADKQKFMRVFKDWCYLGETATDARYLSQANLVARLQEEPTV